MSVRPVLGESVRVADLSFGYHREDVVQGVSFTAKAGGFLGIIGPNGSGKSTLLKLMSGVEKPRGGSVEVADFDIATRSRLELGRHIAVVPQETTMAFPYTVLEMVLFGRTPHLSGFAFENDRDVDVARWALDRTATSHLAQRPVTELSGGERQRVALARALAQEPRVLLLDEPSAFLDIRHEVEMYDLLRELANEGMTIVSVLHDLNLAALYCEHIVLLSDGAVYRQGRPEEVMNYENLTTVYGTEIYVSLNDITGTLNILPLDVTHRAQLAARRAEGEGET